MKQPHHPAPNPAPGTRSPEYVIEAWVSPQLKDRIRRAATRADPERPELQGEAQQAELEAEP